MKVGEIMTRDVVTAQMERSILEVAKEMARHDVGAIPVMDGEQVVGIVTDRDIVIRALALGIGVTTERVATIMSPSVIAITEEGSVEDAVKLMEDKQVRRLVVRTLGGGICGIVSASDVAICCDTATGGEMLQEVSRADKRPVPSGAVQAQHY